MSVPCVLQTLEAALKKALKSDYEDICLGLLMTPAQFDAHLFRKATHVNISGLHTKCPRILFPDVILCVTHCCTVAPACLNVSDNF